MSDPNETRTYKTINNDAENEDEEENYNDDIDSRCNSQRQVDPPALGHRFNEGRLLNGELINPKNTLESFDHLETQATPPPVATATTAKPATTKPTPRLIDGRTIDYKNTMQSYDHLVPPRQPVALLNMARDDEVHVGGIEDRAGEALTNVDTNLRINTSNRNNNNNSTNRNNNTFYVEAVVVNSFAVTTDAEITDSNPLLQRGVYFWPFMVSLVVMACFATAAGVYCGTGKCSGGDDTSSAITSNNVPPSVSTIPNTTTTAPTTNITSSDSTMIPTNRPAATPTETPSASPAVSADSPTADPTMEPSRELTNATLTTDAPVIRPITAGPVSEQQLSVACNFLSLTNLTECRSITAFSSPVLGGNTIPTEMGLLTQLTILDLSNPNEMLTGTIPSTLGYLTQLTYLTLYSNELTGPIPSTLGNLLQLTDLSLSENQLTGTIPSTLGNLKQLNQLGLRFNRLTGPIPSTLGKLTQLNDIVAPFNQLNGTIPSTLGSLTQLESLWLHNNTQLMGTIPSTLCSVSGIRIYIDCANVACTCCLDVYTLGRCRTT